MSFQYSVSGLPRSDFDEAHRLVQAMSTRSINLRYVTDDQSSLSRDDQHYLLCKKDVWGLCCRSGFTKVKYDLWFNPEFDYDKNPAVTSILVLHELGHAYRAMGHGVPFKYFHGRSIYHYCDLVQPIPDVDLHVLFMLDKYTLKKANEKPQEYRDRLVQERDKIRETAELEQDRVRETYANLS